MKSRRFSLAIAFALVLFFVFAFGLSPLMKPSTAAPAPAENAPFKGKLVLVVVASQHSLLLEHVQVRKLGDLFFLVGKGSEENIPGHWTKGHMEWIPMNRIETLTEFENVEEWKKAWKASEELQKNAPAPPPAQAGQAGQAGSP